MQYRGDLGLFRASLMLAGFCPQSEDMIFNDNTRDGKRRRLKLWFADRVFQASQEQQKVLEQHLRDAFGKRILCMYFSQNVWHWSGNPGKSLCIRLKA
jgi:hypothetical protein